MRERGEKRKRMTPRENERVDGSEKERVSTIGRLRERESERERERERERK